MRQPTTAGGPRRSSRSHSLLLQRGRAVSPRRTACISATPRIRATACSTATRATSQHPTPNLDSRTNPGPVVPHHPSTQLTLPTAHPVLLPSPPSPSHTLLLFSNPLPHVHLPTHFWFWTPTFLLLNSYYPISHSFFHFVGIFGLLFNK